ncbi:MAG: hypothetical protein M3271_07270 [Actinomycetota bacterium]|nr:hypothetical protein [Actinomycetota bacterium]
MSPTERRMARWLTFTGVVHAAGAAGALLRARSPVIPLENGRGAPIVSSNRFLAPTDEPPEVFAFVGGYLAASAAVALAIARDPQARRTLVPPLLIGKAGTSAALLYRYAWTRRRAYAAVAAVNAVALGVTAGLYSALDD